MKRALFCVAVPLALAGCATATIDRSLDEVRSKSKELTGVEPRLIATEDERRAAAAAVDALLAKPLTADAAVKIALAHSPAAQALMHENAAALAAAVQRGRIVNPRFTFERLRRGDDLEISRMLSFELVDLVTWPLRSQMADARVQQDKVRAIGDVVELAADARKAWVEAVAAGQALRYHRDVMTAADASADLARRMQGVGNFSKLQRDRQQAFYADAALQLARAQHAALAARERLVRQLGLDAERARKLTLPERLPDLPAAPRPEADTVKIALDQRLDVTAARRSLEHVAKLGGLTRVRSVVNSIELGVERNSETGLPLQRGFEVELALPVFDPGDALRAEVRSTYLAAVNRTRQVMLDAQSQVRESYHAYRSAYDIARHYRDEIVPLRQSIADENLLRYNGMLVGVFELLADAREQVASVIAAIDAQREFWLADARLQNDLIGRPQAAPRRSELAPRAAADGSGSPH